MIENYEDMVEPKFLTYGQMANGNFGYVAGQVEITTECFQRCPHCLSWQEYARKEQKYHWPLDRFQDLCMELSRDHPHFRWLSLTGGDPPRNPEFDDMLDWFCVTKAKAGFKFQLQLHTPLVHKFSSRRYRESVGRIRVSLDAIRQGTYKSMRGMDIDPRTILDRIGNLDHPHLSTFTVVTEENLDEMYELLSVTNAYRKYIKKCTFFPVMQQKELSPEFWRRYVALQHIAETEFEIPVDFCGNDNTASFINSDAAKPVPCYAKKLSFHMKVDGSVYPCCLIGGEALNTVEMFRQGMWPRDSLLHLQSENPGCAYFKNSPCLTTCQWKQLQLNLAGYVASRYQLHMP